MVPNPYGLDRLIADRREELRRAAEQARLARQARGHERRVSRPSRRARLAEALRCLADRLEASPARV